MSHNDLINKWQHVLDRVNIPTWTEVLTLAYLAELASKSQQIIECGTYLGASAKVMLQANPKLRLVCIDTFACVGEPMMLDYLSKHPMEDISPNPTTFQICAHSTLQRPYRDGRIIFIVGDSATAAKHLVASVSLAQSQGHDWQHEFDAVWVDDGHTEEDVQRDIRCLMPFLKSGGEMVGHDFEVPHNDVARGVIASGITYDVPIPRMWRHIKP